jgi:hypothetical protein
MPSDDLKIGQFVYLTAKYFEDYEKEFETNPLLDPNRPVKIEAFNKGVLRNLIQISQGKLGTYISRKDIDFKRK